MIYTNKKLEATARTLEFGVIHQIGMGQFGHERKFIALTCPEGTVLENGMNPDFTIGETWSRKPRINKKKDNDLFLLLSAEGECSSDEATGYDGDIMVLEAQKKKFKIMARGNGRGGPREDHFYWDCMLLKAPATTALVRVCPSGDVEDVLSTVYLIHEGAVYQTNIESIVETCEELGIEVPCEIVEDDGVRYFGEDWIVL